MLVPTNGNPRGRYLVLQAYCAPAFRRHTFGLRGSMTNRNNVVRLACAALMLLNTGTAMAQGSGTIQGTVTDPSGAIIPQASVTAKNVATGVETTRQTTAAGVYVLSPLAPGEYRVSAAATASR